MKKIITAISNQKISLKIKQECNVQMVLPDIQYQEGVIEALEKEKEAEILILNGLLEGEFNIYKFINKIREKNKNIKIIILLEKKDSELENFLNSKNIIDIFYNNKNTIEELIKKINENNKENNLMENKINNKIREKNKVIKIINKIKNKYFNNKIKKTSNINNSNKIIAISGNNGIGKSIFCALISKIINKEKILIIDFDLKNSSINSIFGIKKNSNNDITKINKKIYLYNPKKIIENNKLDVEKYYKKIKELKKIYKLILIDLSNTENLINIEKIFSKINLIIFLSEGNLTGIEKSKKIIENYINNLKIKKEKIKIIFNKININSVHEKILKQIFLEEKIILIKLNKKYDFFINTNLKIIDNKTKKEYKKIIEKINI